MAEKKKNYYETLNIDPSASADEIKKAYRSQAITNHPDKQILTTEEITQIKEEFAVKRKQERRTLENKNKSQEAINYFVNQHKDLRKEYNITNKQETKTKIAEEKFKAVTEAWEILQNSESRQKYDANSLFDIDDEFKKQGWVNDDGQVKESTGTVGGEIGLESIIDEVQSKDQFKDYTDFGALDVYMTHLVANNRFQDYKNASSVFDKGFTHIADIAIKEGYYTKEEVMEIIQENIENIPNAGIYSLSKNLDGILEVTQKIGVDTDKEVAEIKEDSLEIIDEYVNLATEYQNNYEEHEMNPAHAYRSIEGALSLRKNRLFMKDEEIKEHNKELEQEVFETVIDDLYNSIDGMEKQETKWYFNMIKYVTPLLGNYERISEVKKGVENILKEFKSEEEINFAKDIKKYMEIKTVNNYKQQKQQTTYAPLKLN